MTWGWSWWYFSVEGTNAKSIQCLYFTADKKTWLNALHFGFTFYNYNNLCRKSWPDIEPNQHWLNINSWQSSKENITLHAKFILSTATCYSCPAYKRCSGIYSHLISQSTVLVCKISFLFLHDNFHASLSDFCGCYVKCLVKTIFSTG